MPGIAGGRPGPGRLSVNDGRDSVPVPGGRDCRGDGHRGRIPRAHCRSPPGSGRPCLPTRRPRHNPARPDKPRSRRRPLRRDNPHCPAGRNKGGRGVTRVPARRAAVAPRLDGAVVARARHVRIAGIVVSAVVVFLGIPGPGGVCTVPGPAGIPVFEWTGKIARVAAVAAGLAVAVVPGGGQILVSRPPRRAGSRRWPGFRSTRGQRDNPHPGRTPGRPAVRPGGRLVRVPGCRDRIGRVERVDGVSPGVPAVGPLRARAVRALAVRGAGRRARRTRSASAWPSSPGPRRGPAPQGRPRWPGGPALHGLPRPVPHVPRAGPAGRAAETRSCGPGHPWAAGTCPCRYRPARC